MLRNEDRKGKSFNPELRGEALKELQQLGRVSIRRAAALLDKHPYTVKDHIQRGTINAVSLGRRDWVFLDEILRLLEPSECKPGGLYNLVKEIKLQREAVANSNLDDTCGD